MVEPGESAPNDYYIRNRNPKLRELEYVLDVPVHPEATCSHGVEVCGYPARDLPALVRRLRDETAPFYAGAEGVRVWLTVRDGVVVDIENPYFP